jgi:hypothetical protein
MGVCAAEAAPRAPASVVLRRAPRRGRQRTRLGHAITGRIDAAEQVGFCRGV